MALFGKCRFCGENGHSISLCSHNNKLALMHDMNQEIEQFTSRQEIKRYLYRLPSLHFEILASGLRLPVGMPRFMAYKTVENHYVSLLSIRQSRINRYELEVEDTASTYVPPHSLFQRIADSVYSVGNSIYQLFWRPTRMADRETLTQPSNTRRFHWSIVPELKQSSVMNKVECPICIEKKMSTAMITPVCPCKNSFCNDCFMEYLNKHTTKEPNCPICRHAFKQVDVYNVYLFNEYVRLFTKV